MVETPGISLAVSIAGLVIVSILSLSAVKRLVLWIVPWCRLGSADDESFKHFYTDKDGEATPESVIATSSAALSITTAIAGIAVGALSLSRAIVTKIDAHYSWLQFAISVRTYGCYPTCPK